MRAIALQNNEDVSVGSVVHHTTPQWSLTSQYPLNFVFSCDDGAVYNRILPGRLGMFVYPLDVRFHMNGRSHTTMSDFENVVRAEQLLLNRERAQKMQHISVTHDLVNDFISNHDAHNGSDEEEDEEEDDEDDEEDEENGPATATGIEECIESEDDGGES